jgi:hypothetical protein
MRCIYQATRARTCCIWRWRCVFHEDFWRSHRTGWRFSSSRVLWRASPTHKPGKFPSVSEFRRFTFSLITHQECYHHRLYNSVRVLASLLGFVTIIFMVWGCHPHTQPPTWRTRVPLLAWVITFDLSSKGDPVSSYAAASIALRIIWSRKPHHYVKVGIPSVGTKNVTWHNSVQFIFGRFLILFLDEGLALLWIFCGFIQSFHVSAA